MEMSTAPNLSKLLEISTAPNLSKLLTAKDAYNVVQNNNDIMLATGVLSAVCKGEMRLSEQQEKYEREMVGYCII